MPTINLVKTVANPNGATGISFTATAVQGVNTFPLTATYSAPNLTISSSGDIGVSGNFTFNVVANYTAFGTTCSDNISFSECKTNYTTQFRSNSIGNDSCGNAAGSYNSNLASYYSLITATEFSTNGITYVPPAILEYNACGLSSTPPLLRTSKSTFDTSAKRYMRITFSDGIVLTSNTDYTSPIDYTLSGVKQLNDYQTEIYLYNNPPLTNLNFTLTYTSGIDNLPKTVNASGDGSLFYTYLLNDRIKNQTTVTVTTTKSQSSSYVNFVPEVVC
jgi:hypothetical protein